MSRIYLVKASGKERLVEASTKTTAINHAARDTIAAEVCGQADLVRLLKDGTEIERAGRAEPEEA